ncbi:MAG: glycosyltransferase family 2 protein [Acidobacteria bacterium]|nr:glycosyltransferase family 2 protein [Acidobacteriota bacterium]
MLAPARLPVKAGDVRRRPPESAPGILSGVRTAVVIPARNEEASLPLVLGAIPPRLVEEVVVVDNSSTDRTAEAARSWGASILFEPRPGYGAACQRGVDYLKMKRPDVVVFLDADFSDHPEEMPLLLGPIARGTADLVIGSRVLGRRERGALLPQARLGNWLATRLVNHFYGGRFTDLGPFRAIRFGALLDLRMADRGFGWTAEMQVKALKAGLRTAEVPVSYRRRVGVSKITGTVSGTVRAGARILWTIGRHL